MASETYRRSWPRPMRSLIAAALACHLLSACSSSTTQSGGAPADAGGPGSIMGSLDGGTLDHVGAAWLIGAPDDPKQTRVIYVFDRAIKCSELAKPGWDETVADGTRSLEMKLIGTQPGKYPVAKSGRPATGESDVNYTLTSTSSTPSEVLATSGSVTLAHISDGKSADGAFNLTFAQGKISGDFQATYCAAGHEP